MTERFDPEVRLERDHGREGSDTLAWLVMEADGANSFTPAKVDAMTRALRAATGDRADGNRDDPPVDAVLLYGEGQFSVGADLDSFASADDPTDGVRATVEASNRFIRAVRATDRPVVAAVEGVAAGGGLGFALACDLVAMDAGATLDPAYARIALTPDNGVPYFFAQAVGPYRARELLFDPGPIGADEAADLGIATRVVDTGEPFREAVAAYAREHLTAPAATLGRTKRLVDEAFEETLDEHLEAQRAAIVEASRRGEFRERLAEFVGETSEE